VSVVTFFFLDVCGTHWIMKLKLLQINSLCYGFSKFYCNLQLCYYYYSCILNNRIDFKVRIVFYLLNYFISMQKIVGKKKFFFVLVRVTVSIWKWSLLLNFCIVFYMLSIFDVCKQIYYFYEFLLVLFSK